MKNLIVFIKGLLCLALLAMVNQVVASEITVSKAYIRATIPGTEISSAYMEIANDGTSALELIGATSDVSNRIEIHQHTMADGVMKMRQQASLTIPANDLVKLQPGGYHLMIFNLTKPLKADEKVALTLHFNNQQKLELSVPVTSIIKEKQSQNHHHHH